MMTPWFPADVKPVRIGDYQIAPFGKSDPRWSYWNGAMWSFFTITQDQLSGNRSREMHLANKPWRGLASDPKASKP